MGEDVFECEALGRLGLVFRITHYWGQGFGAALGEGCIGPRVSGEWLFERRLDDG